MVLVLEIFFLFFIFGGFELWTKKEKPVMSLTLNVIL